MALNWLKKICSPIMLDDSGNPRDFYHGTDQKFDQFEHRPGKRYVLFSEFDVNTPGHFFSETPEDAREYGRNIMQRKLNINNMLLDPKKFPHMGVDRFPDDLERDLRYILKPLIIKGEKGRAWLEVGVRTTPVRDKDWIYNLIGRNGLLWDALDNPEVVKRMKEKGYDGTYVEESEGKRSVFVTDNTQII